jgi:FkbM family methyltransferase
MLKKLFRGDNPDARKLAWIKDYTKEDAVVLDVGACVGHYTKIFDAHLGQDGKLIAFEPESKNYNNLLEIETFKNNVILENKAVSNFVGESELFIGPHAGWHSLKHVNRFNKKDEIQKVQVTTIDEYLSSVGLSYANIIKMDAEGADLEVLQGAAKTIDNSPCMVILAEIHIDHNIDLEGIFNFLIGKGFCIYDIKKSNGNIIDTVESLSNEIIAIKI